ncbi:MAG: hypothetical protein J5586_07915 [Clostridia bacterium]|nr:hypothetical protein [Clostridia bacterium]
MRAFNKYLCIAAALLTAALLTAGCRNSGSQTADPTAAPLATETPELFRTPDPAKYQLSEDGYFEDEYLSANWPSMLEYTGHLLNNNAQYRGYLPDGRKLLFTYLTDDGASFEEEIANHDADSYQKFIRETINEYFDLYEFEYITVDGHRALRVLYDYAPPDDEAHRVHVLQYLIDVKGWVMTLTFTTQGEFPASCDECVGTIRFKDGY